MLSQDDDTIIYYGISALEHVRELVYGIIYADTSFIFKLMTNVVLTGSKRHATDMAMKYETCNADVILA